jgi:hypothetical protein
LLENVGAFTACYRDSFTIYLTFIKLGLLRAGEEQRLRMAENRALKTVFGLNTGAVTDGWTTSYESLQNLYSSANIVSMTNQGETDEPYMGDIINRDVITWETYAQMGG